MSNETEHPIGAAPHPVYRTTPARTGKMLIIMWHLHCWWQ